MPRARLALRVVGALAAALAAATTAPDAHACGGCFVPPSESSVVTGHRMVFSISPVQSVLWDQIQYSGNPAEFAWVLPVKKGAWIEASTDAWFEVLEATTKMSVQAPSANCGGSGFGCMGSAASADLSGAEGGGNGEPVKVVHEGTVGPYDTVTLETTTQGVLVDWLKAHDFAVEDGIEPVIDAYVAEGFDFIALRLQPNAGIRQMKPVRIVSPGASATLPLRMVAAGSAADVSIILYVVGEGRWKTSNFPALSVPLDLLSWDFAAQTSNYAELRAATLTAAGGRGWLTTYAQPNTFFDFVTLDNFDSARFSDLYVKQGIDNHEIDTPCQLPDLSNEGTPVIDPCPPNVPWDDPTCVGVPSGVDARNLVCGALDDLAVALTGMHPRDVWVTRLEASIPRKALDADLVLEAASPQEIVRPFQVARLAENPDSACPSATIPLPGQKGSSSRSDSAALVVLGSAALLGALAALRRRRRVAPA